MSKEYNTSLNLNSSYSSKTLNIGDTTPIKAEYTTSLKSNIFGVIVAILIGIALFKVLSNSQPFTFQ